jgi:peptide/nickel transport system ATP-binding protein
MAIMGLHKPDSVQMAGSINLGGTELVGASPELVRSLRGKRMAMIFQDPLSAMHPFYTVGAQIIEAYQVHNKVSKKVARDHAIDMLGRVGIPQPAKRVDDYPHQFSGGMRQRAMIAMALSCDPDLLIADEPTTALDVTVQAQILDLIRDLQRDFNAAVIVITHDLGVVAELADDMLVMYAGRSSGVLHAEDGLPSAAASLHLGAARVVCRGWTASPPTGSCRSRAPRRADPGAARLPVHPRCTYVDRVGAACSDEPAAVQRLFGGPHRRLPPVRGADRRRLRHRIRPTVGGDERSEAERCDHR